MQELHVLNDKLDLLLKKYAGLQAENKRLKEDLSKQMKAAGRLTEKIAGMENELGAKNIGNAAVTTNDKNNMRKQLDTVINEIDKILNTLND